MTPLQTRKYQVQVHKPFKCCWHIAQPKGHYFEFEQTDCSEKLCLLSDNPHKNLVVPSFSLDQNNVRCPWTAIGFLYIFPFFPTYHQ